MRRQRTRAEIIAELKYKTIDHKFRIGSAATLMAVATVLINYDGWTPEEVNQFMENVSEVIHQYEESDIDIETWSNSLQEITGMDFIGGLKDER